MDSILHTRFDDKHFSVDSNDYLLDCTARHECQNVRHEWLVLYTHEWWQTVFNMKNNGHHTGRSDKWSQPMRPLLYAYSKVLGVMDRIAM